MLGLRDLLARRGSYVPAQRPRALPDPIDITRFPQTESVAEIPDGRLMGVTSLQRIDWRTMQGWTLLPTRPFLERCQIDTVRHIMLRADQPELRFAISNRGRLRDALPGEIAARYVAYLDEIDDILTRHAPWIWGVVLIRNERARLALDGHQHEPWTMTFTHAELGPSSWFGSHRMLPPADTTAVFTDQFHGTPASDGPRLVTIVFCSPEPLPGEIDDLVGGVRWPRPAPRQLLRIPSASGREGSGRPRWRGR